MAINSIPTKLELLEEMKRVQATQVDRFYRENEDMMAPHQYKTVKKDSEYFMKLVALALAFYRE